jgi:hypothetical protein
MIRRGLVAYGWLAAILLLLAGFAWLTQNPTAVILARAQEWPLVGEWATAFRRAYLPVEPSRSEPALARDPEIEPIAPPPVDIGETRYVWVQPGISLHSEPDLGSAVVETTTSIRNLSLIMQRGDWYLVWVPRSDARLQRAWVLLEDYRPPTRAVLNEPDPVLPLPATAPVASWIVKARQRMQDGGDELGCGLQRLFTDVPEDPVAAVCERVSRNLEVAYRQRYGLRPASPPAEAILLYRRPEDYLAFRDLEELPVDTGLAHASPAKGYLALFRGGRTTSDVLATLVHELTHLLNRRALGPALPPWLSEGMADDLAESFIDDSGAIHLDRLGGSTLRDKDRVVRTGGLAAAIEIQEAIRQDTLPTLRELMEMDESGFYRADRVGLHYGLSSFWIRYLASGFDPGLTRGFRLFLQDVAAGKVMTVDLLQDRAGAGWDDLESGFRAWVHLQFVRPPSETREALR